MIDDRRSLIVVMASGLASRQSRQPPQVSEQQTKLLNLSAYAELLRSDVQAQKIAILTEVMGFTEAEDQAFWPIYRDYDAEMAKLGDERVALIDGVRAGYSQITDDLAQSLATRAVDLDERRNAALEPMRRRASERRCRQRRRSSSCRSSISCC